MDGAGIGSQSFPGEDGGASEVAGVEGGVGLLKKGLSGARKDAKEAKDAKAFHVTVTLIRCRTLRS